MVILLLSIDSYWLIKVTTRISQKDKLVSSINLSLSKRINFLSANFPNTLTLFMFSYSNWSIGQLSIPWAATVWLLQRLLDSSLFLIRIPTFHLNYLTLPKHTNIKGSYLGPVSFFQTWKRNYFVVGCLLRCLPKLTSRICFH